MIIQTPAGEGNPDGEEIDSDANGILDGLATGWTIYDAVTILDDDDSVEFAYSEMIFLEEPDVTMPLGVTLTFDPALSPTIILLNQYPQYVARQGSKTGNAATLDGTHNDDWMAGRVNSRSWPDWKFSSTGTRNFPTAELTSKSLSDFSGLTIGEVNVDFAATASIDDVFASKVSVYPNPANNFVTISSSVDINKIELYNLLGKKVINTSKLVNDKLDVSSIAKGVYLMKLTSGKSVISRKLIKN